MLRKKIFILSFLFLFIFNFNIAYAITAKGSINLPYVSKKSGCYYFILQDLSIGTSSKNKLVNLYCSPYIIFIEKDNVDNFIENKGDYILLKKCLCYVHGESKLEYNSYSVLHRYYKNRNLTISGFNFSSCNPKFSLKDLKNYNENFFNDEFVHFLKSCRGDVRPFGASKITFLENNLMSNYLQECEKHKNYPIILVDTNCPNFLNNRIKKFYYNDKDFYDCSILKSDDIDNTDTDTDDTDTDDTDTGKICGGCNYKKEDLNSILDFLSKILEILKNIDKKNNFLSLHEIESELGIIGLDVKMIRDDVYKSLRILEELKNYMYSNCKLLENIGNKLDNLDFSNLKNLDFSNLKNLDMYIKNILDVNKNILNTSKDILRTNKSILDTFKDFKKDLLEQLEKMYKVILMLDKDDDHPDLFSIYTTNEQILQLLQKKLPNFKNFNSSVGGGTGGDDDGWGHATLYLYNYFKDLAYIEDLLAEINKNSVGKMISDLSNSKPLININNDLSSIKNFIKEVVGNKEDLDKAQKNMEDSFKNLMDKEPFSIGKNTKNAFDNLNNNFNTNKKMSKVSVNIPNIGNMTVFDLELWRPEIDLIRKILACMVWISLFIYFVRVFIPKLKI